MTSRRSASMLTVCGLFLCLALFPNKVSAEGSGFLEKIGAEELPFLEVDVSDRLVVYFHQRMLGEAVVEKDYIVYQFERTTGKLITRKSHWRSELPDDLPEVHLSAEDAGSLVGGRVESAKLILVAPDSDVFPMRPVPGNPCWAVTSASAGRIDLVLVDAVTGVVVGLGVPPPAEGFSLTGPIYFSPCSDSWSGWSQNAASWFSYMGYEPEQVIWPTQDQVREQVQSNETRVFYELAHGGSFSFESGCLDGQDAEFTSAAEIRNWLTDSNKKLFAFIGSCDGLCSTGANSLSYEFRKGSQVQSTAVGYCGMSGTACADCWGYSIDWQDQLFYYMYLGMPVRDAFDQANADYPACAAYGCMRFVGDPEFAITQLEGACCLEETCHTNWSPADCSMQGGEWFPGVLTCDPDPCIERVCCLGSTCQMLVPFDCSLAGGTLFAELEACSPSTCSWGACCLSDSCCYTVAPACSVAAGQWSAGLDCDPDPCVESACCIGDACQILGYQECVLAEGQFLEGYSCDPNPCVERACCLGTLCELRNLQACTGVGGVWHADVEVCDVYACLPDSMNLFDGVLIVHAPPGFEYTDGQDWCEHYDEEFRITESMQQVTRVDPSSPEEAFIWYALAAWEESKEWCGVSFGLGSYDAEHYVCLESGPCHGGGLESSTSGWPGPLEGTTLLHADRWAGNYEPVYWFVAYAYAQEHVPLVHFEQAGESGLRNCRGLTFPIACFGSLGLYADGDECHPGQQWACCVSEGCEVMSHSACLARGGEWRVGDSTCEPDPCPPSATPSLEAMEALGHIPGLEVAPNPFGGDVCITFVTIAQGRKDAAAASTGRIRLTIHDVAGRVVRCLADGEFEPGSHSLTWDQRDDSGAPVDAGVYFCHLSMGEMRFTKRITIVH